MQETRPFYGVAHRLMRYVQVFTDADPNSDTQPSSLRQLDLGKMLVAELLEMGIADAELDEFGYVYATIPATTNKPAPTICFCAHMDTAPDVSGEDVKPRLITSYDGAPISYPDDQELTLTQQEHPYLTTRIGDDLIVASGKTLLGADDKAGISIIMELAHYLMAHPDIEHGKIRILFTPDEEIGRGVDKVNMQKLGADFGYTLDGGERGSLEGESFSADGATLTFYGISAHPGYAKGKMVNALKVAAKFLASLPQDEWAPEVTELREGFVHPLGISGNIEECKIDFIIRDHDTSKLTSYAARLQALAMNTIAEFDGAKFSLNVKQQYRNMREVLDKHPLVMELAKKAYRSSGLTPKVEAIRGGTDGSRLSFMGLPCPNIFTGEMAIHSKLEYVSVNDMEKATEVILNICKHALMLKPTDYEVR